MAEQEDPSSHAPEAGESGALPPAEPPTADQGAAAGNAPGNGGAEHPTSPADPGPGEEQISQQGDAIPQEAAVADAGTGSSQDKRATPEELDRAVRAESRRYTRRSFAIAAAAAAAGYGFYDWIGSGPADEMQPVPLRRAFQTNAAISRAIFQERALAPTYPLSRAENLRVNGVYGLKKAMIPGSWRLQVVGVRDALRHPRFAADVTAWQYRYLDSPTSEDQGHDTKTPPASARTSEKMAPKPMLEQERQRENRSGRMPRGREEAGESRSTLPQGTSGLLLTMEDILQLPRHELVTQFKCIEGWSQIVHWAGVRMADFLEAYPPALVGGKQPRFVYMETPDGDYYTGYDMKVCRHPQTLLVTEMMGAPLTQFHGSPLRLHMPTKYGYKQIKRIALICYTDDKPDDYWTKLGYDWYAGL
jgi:Oxidoreductase molybdopterin binding domain